MTRPVVSLPDGIRRRIIDHCISELPNEGCGLLAMDDETIVRVYLTSNQDASPNSYTIPPQEHYEALVDAESRGLMIGGVFHSHPAGPPAMSTTDVGGALEPEWLYVVVGLDGDEPEVTGWRDGTTVAL